MIAGGLERVCSDAPITCSKRSRELCLFSKNCGNGRALLAYSVNCQANNASREGATSAGSVMNLAQFGKASPVAGRTMGQQ